MQEKVVSKRDSYQTMRLSCEQICRGREPWVALSGFMNDWYANHFFEREQLIIDPLPETYPPGFHQWVAFCAASVRWFCSTYEVPCPSWVDDPRYVLSEPWYMDDHPSLWMDLRETTAEEFIQHNIYCGNSVYKNKYECDERGLPMRGGHPVDVQERRAWARKMTERLAQKWTEQQRRIDEYMPTALALRATYAARKQAEQQ